MSKIKVMVVEDESIVAIDIGQRLLGLGYEVTATVSTGEKAIEMAEKTSPNIILMDIVLKGQMDGIQAAAHIVEKFKIPVVYLTAYSDEKTLKRAKVTGPFGYIIKPFEDRELHSVIEIALYKHDLESRLKESEEKYRITVNSINDILFTLDLDEKCTMVSDPQLQRYGLKSEDFIGKNPFEQFGVTTSAHHEANAKALNGENVVYDWSTRINENTVYFQTSVSPLKNANGEIIGITGLLRDITALKKTKEALSFEMKTSKALADLSQKLLSSISLEDISNQVLKYAKELTGSEFCFVGFVEPGTKNLINFSLTKEVWSKCHVENIFKTEFDFNSVGGIWGWVLDNKKSILSNNPAEDERSKGTPKGHVPIKSFLSAPAIMNNELVGQIALANADHPYTDQDLSLTERLADIYALAIYRKLSEEKLTKSEEKNRIIVEKFLKIVSEMMAEIK